MFVRVCISKYELYFYYVDSFLLNSVSKSCLFNLHNFSKFVFSLICFPQNDSIARNGIFINESEIFMGMSIFWRITRRIN